MYESITTVDGGAAVVSYVGSTEVADGPDGLIFAPANGSGPGNIAMPARLMDWLVDLRLLRHIPIVYLVPDSALLPTESIRIFHVDTTWMDRVIDGVFSAANTGTVDAVFNYGLLASARKETDDALVDLAKASVPATNWTPDIGMSGMLIRSELARRWPDMIVEAWDKVIENWEAPITAKLVPILRKESISRDIFILLFAGQPKMVTIREPFTGVRFGVEPRSTNTPNLYKIDARNTNGTNILDAEENAVPINIAWRNQTYRNIHFANLASLGVDNSARQVAINLEQKPYLQEFKDTREEPLGTQELTDDMDSIGFRKGRYMKLEGLRARLLQQQRTSE